MAAWVNYIAITRLIGFSIDLSKAWADFDQCIRIEGREGILLTCEDTEAPKTLHVARHRQSFSSEFPYFEVRNNFL